MSKKESFEEWYNNDSGYEDAVELDLQDYDISGMVRVCRKAWNHQQAKLDEANEAIEILEKCLPYLIEKNKKLESENKQLKEAFKLAVEVVRDLIDKTEYGVNQWQAAWLPDEETASQKSIREARQFLESEQYKKVEGSL